VTPSSGTPQQRSNAARHVRPDLRVQDLELLSEQRPQEQGQDDEIEEDGALLSEALCANAGILPSSSD